MSRLLLAFAMFLSFPVSAVEFETDFQVESKGLTYTEAVAKLDAYEAKFLGFLQTIRAERDVVQNQANVEIEKLREDLKLCSSDTCKKEVFKKIQAQNEVKRLAQGRAVEREKNLNYLRDVNSPKILLMTVLRWVEQDGWSALLRDPRVVDAVLTGSEPNGADGWLLRFQILRTNNQVQDLFVNWGTDWRDYANINSFFRQFPETSGTLFGLKKAELEKAIQNYGSVRFGCGNSNSCSWSPFGFNVQKY